MLSIRRIWLCAATYAARRFAEDEPGTLDPRLPRPAGPKDLILHTIACGSAWCTSAGLPDLNKYTESQREEMFHDARMEASQRMLQNACAVRVGEVCK